MLPALGAVPFVGASALDFALGLLDPSTKMTIPALPAQRHREPQAWKDGRRALREGDLISFTGVGGLEIFTRSWLPAADPRAVVVIAHGVSEHLGRYEHVAERLVEAGYAVEALDHRGHGRSQGDRAVIDRMQRAVDDLASFVIRAGAEHAGEKVFLLGHSMGGCISLELALQRPKLLDGLILSAPAAALESASPVELFLGRILSAVAPRTGVFEVDSGTVSRDPEVVADYDADPLGYHGKLPARTVSEMAGVIKAFPARVPSLELPLLVMLGTDDRLVPPAAGRMVEELAASADKRLIEYDGLYHEILNEPEKGKVMDDLVAWLDERT